MPSVKLTLHATYQLYEFPRAAVTNDPTADWKQFIFSQA